MQQIVVNKANYIGKPFFVLEQDLKLKIKNFSSIGKEAHKNEATSTIFRFRSIREQGDRFYPRLKIFWKEPYLSLIKSDSIYMRDRKNIGVWDREAESLYRSCVIEDIQAR